MNKRIRELAEQAGSTHKQNLGVYQFYADELDKFAELLIKECAQVCQTMPPLGPYKNVQVATLEDACTLILEHFGVEA
jgi:hypothetical protein